MPYKRLFVPVDGSELSDKAITASLDLARQLGATVVGWVAEPEPPLPGGPRNQALMKAELLSHDAQTAAHAHAVLARFEAAAQASGVPFEAVFDQVPRIGPAIVAAAESQRCDMIVMVTHGRGALGELFFGSQTKAVLAASRLPLLVLH